MSITSAIELEYPFADVHAGTTVLAAAIRLFGPQDGVELVVTSAGAGIPDRESLELFRKLYVELALPYGPPPPVRLAFDEAERPALTRIAITGDPVEDADAVLRLGSLARHLGAGYAYGNMNRLRGGATLLRLEHEAAARRRIAHPLAGHRSRGDRAVRIAVLIQRTQVWGALESIVLAGLRHPGVLLDVVLLRDRNADYRVHEAGEFAAFCAERGIELRDEDWLGAHLGQIDIALVHDAYGNRWSTGRGFSTRELADAGIRVVLSPYAQALSGSPGNLATLHDMPLHNYAWRIYAPSAGAAANFARYCAAGGDHVRNLGSPKREHLLTDTKAAAEAAVLRKRLGTRTVTLWNPHFDSEDGLSTFGTMLEPILGWFGERRQRSLIVRPHPKLFTDYERLGHGDVVATFRRMCAMLPNVYLDESIDAAPAMLAADALLSDLSSLIAEYDVLNRPMGLLRPTPDLELNEDRECLARTVPIDNRRGLAAFLERVRPAASGEEPRGDDLGAGERIVASMVEDFWAALG
jgi:hypothetical protein